MLTVVPSVFSKLKLALLLFHTALTMKSALPVVIFVLPLIFVIFHPRRTPACPAGDDLSTDFTRRSPSALKNTLIPKSPEIPELTSSHSVCFAAKLQRSTADGKPASVLY